MAKHLTELQRYEISFRLQNKERPIDIAKALGVHRAGSTGKCKNSDLFEEFFFWS